MSMLGRAEGSTSTEKKLNLYNVGGDQELEFCPRAVGMLMSRPHQGESIETMIEPGHRLWRFFCPLSIVIDIHGLPTYVPRQEQIR
jgi:hypothetical protein